MKSIDFPEAMYQLAKDQPEYKTLYTNVQNTPARETIFCMELSEEDLVDIVREKKLWVMQLTFGNPFQPMSIHTKNVFQEPIITDKVPADENRTPGEEWDRTHYESLETNLVPVIPTPCKNCGKEWNQHFWSTRQCEL